MYKIDFYEDRDSYSEIEDFLDQLRHSHQKNNVSLLNKITKELYMLQNLCPRLREPHAKFLKGYAYPIMELRPMPERIFYAAWQKDHFVLLHHYTKKTNKTDHREILRAQANLEDWLSRKEEN